MLKKLDTGLLVTDVMGQGVSTVTATTRAAHPVLGRERRDCLSGRGNHDRIEPARHVRGIVAIGADVDPRSSILTGSILVDRMTVAGEGGGRGRGLGLTPDEPSPFGHIDTLTRAAQS
jgi:PmbA protein